MPNALRFKHTDVGRQQGEQARFKVIHGPDYGAVYVILGQKASIGRGEENDIVISDLKASRVHSVVSITANGWIIKDSGSANGILYNGRATREAKLKIGDTLTLGETTLEFTTSDVGTMMLVAPPRSVDQFHSEQRRVAELQGKNKAMGLGDRMPSDTSSPDAAAKKRRFMLIGGGAIIAAFLLLVLGRDDKKSPPKKNPNNKQDLASFLPQTEKNKTAEMLFKDGFREYLNGNFSRARTQFETVLQIVPGHPLATLYLENCTKSVEDSVKHHLESGKKSFSAGKLRDARAHFERIMRLLYRDQSNPAYIEAKEQNEKLEKEMKEMSEEGS